MQNQTPLDRITKLVFHLILAIASLACLVPMVLTISISLTSEHAIAFHGYRLIPREFSVEGYRQIFRQPAALISAYWVTIRITVFGTFLGTLFMSMAAFPLSRPDFTWRRPIILYLIFTMLFDAGLVPTYMLITQYLHLQNTLAVQFLPLMISPWFMFLLLTYMRQLPFELFESAKVEGAGEFYIYLRIAVPLSKPALATVGLLLALAMWNEWYQALLYITKQSLVPLQFWMQRVMQNIQFLLARQGEMGSTQIDFSKLPTEPMRMAMAILAAGPMMFVFPFFQRYFARGLQIGSVKG